MQRAYRKKNNDPTFLAKDRVEKTNPLSSSSFWPRTVDFVKKKNGVRKNRIYAHKFRQKKRDDEISLIERGTTSSHSLTPSPI